METFKLIGTMLCIIAGIAFVASFWYAFLGLSVLAISYFAAKFYRKIKREMDEF